LVIHFPSGAKEFITRFLGTDSWQQTVKTPKDVVKLVDVLRS